MNTVANLIDSALVGLFVLTLALIVYKVSILWIPRVSGAASWKDYFYDKSNRAQQFLNLESGLVVLSVTASVAPFLGLAGTVMHIIEALRSMSLGAVDMALISGPIATALNATLWGLASALPAAIAHAFMHRRIQVLETLYAE
ncbi:MotA/TolQ/ExbB proton channel family protein [Nostoc sp. CHAB 5834]|nr:MotA/TolQ/ExbB proton channel family protein [Nostoc sp. CHAB 5834]